MITKSDHAVVVVQNRVLLHPTERSLALVRRALPVAGAAIALAWSLSKIVPRLLARRRAALQQTALRQERRLASPDLLYHARMSITIWKKDV